jgi:predicted ATPase
MPGVSFRFAKSMVFRSGPRVGAFCRAGLLLDEGRPSEEVEAALLQSLQIARHQQARSWELRTACDLARLWQQQGRDAEALQLVQATYDQFTEGFDTADLRDAEALLVELECAPLRAFVR